MKGGSENKYGLTRCIEAGKSKKIRRGSGYGCVICGVLFTGYEHIYPEFHVVQEHNSDKMTLLCEAHHNEVSF